ncbi:hypothetical protein ACE6H2_008956 [Prunus campanulata]
MDTGRALLLSEADEESGTSEEAPQGCGSTRARIKEPIYTCLYICLQTYVQSLYRISQDVIKWWWDQDQPSIHWKANNTTRAS